MVENMQHHDRIFVPTTATQYRQSIDQVISEYENVNILLFFCDLGDTSIWSLRSLTRRRTVDCSLCAGFLTMTAIKITLYSSVEAWWTSTWYMANVNHRAYQDSQHFPVGKTTGVGTLYLTKRRSYGNTANLTHGESSRSKMIHY